MNTQLPPPQQKNQPRSSIRETLNRIGAINDKRVELLSSKTRDNPKLNVYRDSVSNVIFIDEYYVGDDEYVSGEYRKQPKPLTKTLGRDYEDITDSERRFKAYRQLITAKDICDFGCGAGSYLKLSQSVAKSVNGIELQQNFAEELNNIGIACHRSLQNIEKPLDVISLFHCFEHLPNPTSTLENIYASLKKNGDGVLIIEVPHARDFLIENLKLKDFIDFTLWSQHLVLHTRESLRLLLADAGFKNITIEGVQRYSLANHLHWLSNKKPGGHKSLLSALQTPELVAAYEGALARIDATDTLVAIATT
jgi:2-polyprenyl-3-methyl-5-hydroxy-6-metoxy-1,4-benzoquinol methylase